MEGADVVVDVGVVADTVVADAGEVVDIAVAGYVVDWVARVEFAKFSHVRYFAI